MAVQDESEIEPSEIGHRRRGRLRTRLHASLQRAQDRWKITTDRARSLVPALDLVWEFFSRYRRLNGSVMVGHVTYRFFLWFAPFLLVFVALLGYTFDSNLAVTGAVEGLGLTEAFVESIAVQAQASRAYLLVFGSVALLYATWGLLRALHYVYAQIWEVPIRPPRGIGRAIGFMLAGALAIVLLTAAVAQIRDGGLLLRLGSGAVSIAGSVALVFGLSLMLPRRTTSVFELLPGAVLAGLTLFLLHAIGQLWLPRKIESSSEMYGTMGVTFAALLYMWAMATIIIGSAFINSVWVDRKSILDGRPLLTDPEQLPKWMRPGARRLVWLVQGGHYVPADPGLEQSEGPGEPDVATGGEPSGEAVDPPEVL